MRQAVFFLTVFLNTEHWMLSPTQAKDFGIHGHTFEIGEPDLLKQMEGKLKQWERQGKLSELNETLLKRTQKSLSEPQPVEEITKATENRTFEYDPSITVPYDLKDHEGKVFHKAGTKINPLEFRSLTQPLVFLDGTDKAQILWVEKTHLQTNQPSKIILIAGSPFQLMKKWQVQPAEDNPSQKSADQKSPDRNDFSQVRPVKNHFGQAQLAQNQPVQLKSTQAKPIKNHFGQAQLAYFDQGGVLTRKLGIRHVPAVVVQDGLKLKISEIVVEEILEWDVQ